VLAGLAGQQWWITDAYAEHLSAAVALVSALGTTSPEEVREQLRAIFAPAASLAPVSVAASLGEPLEGARRATVRDGVAIIPVMGALWHYANIMTALCGDTSYEQIMGDLRAVEQAHAAGTVYAALLEVDGPGGVVAGCAVTARAVRQLAGTMPVQSIITGQGCSASYYVAAGASRVFVQPGTLTGSIGTVATFRLKPTGDGEVLEIVSEQSPKKRPDLRTPEGQAQARVWVNDLGGEFVADMATFRGVTEDEVLERFGQGDIMAAARAVEAGLADGISSFERVLADLAQRAPAARRGNPARGGITGSQETTAMADTQRTPQERATTFAAEHPDAAAIIRAEGAEAAATAERSRILAIDAATLPGFEAVTAPLKNDSTKTAGDAALAIIAAQREGKGPAATPAPAPDAAAAGAAHLSLVQRVETGAPKPPALPVNGSAADDPAKAEADELDAIMKAGA
jgi:ClpP class serine protease